MSQNTANRVELTYPLTLASGKTLSSITLRRPKVRDLKAAQKHGGSDADTEVMLLALLSAEQLAPEDLDELDLEDYVKLQAMFRQMAGKSG